MSPWEAIVLGVVEGLTEFLPVSSTGHLILTADLLGIEQTEFVKSFEIAIQLGAILAVVVLYARTLLLNREIVKRVAVAFIPTAVAGALLYGLLKTVLLEDSRIVLAALFLGGLFMIGFELLHRARSGPTDLSTLPYSKALLIGAFQGVAIVPGVSRAAATIIGGLFLGLNRRAIVEFSFLLAVPTMAAATGYDLLRTFRAFTVQEAAMLAIGFVVSFATAVLGIKFLLSYIQKRSVIGVGVYRIVLAVVFFLLVV
jgi:undecaprenyl-diphosphatase